MWPWSCVSTWLRRWNKHNWWTICRLQTGLSYIQNTAYMEWFSGAASWGSYSCYSERQDSWNSYNGFYCGAQRIFNLLGLLTLGIMNLIHVNRDIFDIASISEQDRIRAHPTVFVDAQGKLPGKTTLHVSESHKPGALLVRNLPFAVRDETKLELDCLMKKVSWPLWPNQRNRSVRWQWLGRKMAPCASAFTLHPSTSL